MKTGIACFSSVLSFQKLNGQPQSIAECGSSSELPFIKERHCGQRGFSFLA